MIRKFRVWFRAGDRFWPDYLIPEGQEGIVIEAYTAEDAITQAKTNIPHMFQERFPTPLERVTILRIEPQIERGLRDEHTRETGQSL